MPLPSPHRIARPPVHKPPFSASLPLGRLRAAACERLGARASFVEVDSESFFPPPGSSSRVTRARTSLPSSVDVTQDLINIEWWAGRGASCPSRRPAANLEEQVPRRGERWRLTIPAWKNAAMNDLRALIVFVALGLSACGGTDERTCALLGDMPVQVGEATVEQVEGVAQAARESEVSELRTLGAQLTSNLARGPALERLAAGAFLEVVQADLDALRRACGDFERG